MDDKMQVRSTQSWSGYTRDLARRSRDWFYWRLSGLPQWAAIAIGLGIGSALALGVIIEWISLG